MAHLDLKCLSPYKSDYLRNKSVFFLNFVHVILSSALSWLKLKYND